jgi:hypothetical protein
MPSLDGYTGSTYLIQDQLLLYWTPSQSSISFGVVANTSGYVAVGIAATGFANGTGADVMMAAYESGGVAVLDMKINAKTEPAGFGTCPNSICRDTSISTCANDLTVTYAARNGSYLIIRYTRQQITGDATCDNAIHQGSNEVVWAIGPGTISDGLFTKHTVAGQRGVDFGISPPPEDDSCKQYTDTDCSTCTDVQKCVWCDDTTACSDGKPNGLTITVPKDCKYWYWGQCTIAGEALGTPFTYSILLSLAVLIFVCCCLAICLVVGKLVNDRRHDNDDGFKMKAYH